MLLGALITLAFTAANVYLGLKVGLTFASAIPAAVISMALLYRFKDSNILENNMVQTQASAAGTLSSVIFVLPALLMLGLWSGFPFWQTALICAAGGTLGVLYTVPLRRVMVVQSDLPYPEGVAAAEVLRVGDAQRHAKDAEQNTKPRSSGLRDLGWGTGLAAVFGFLSSGLRLLGDSFNFWIPAGGVAFRVAAGFSPALLAAGYLMGAAAGIAVLVGLVRGAVADGPGEPCCRAGRDRAGHPAVGGQGAFSGRRRDWHLGAVDGGNAGQAHLASHPQPACPQSGLGRQWR